MVSKSNSDSSSLPPAVSAGVSLSESAEVPGDSGASEVSRDSCKVDIFSELSSLSPLRASSRAFNKILLKSSGTSFSFV